MGFRFLFFMCVVTLSGLSVSAAWAQCIAGLPCVTAASADPSSGPNASKSGGADGCDADFMNQIYARAFIESEREVTIAGQDIRKPDSVLQYSCFHMAAKDALSAHNPEFSADSGTPGSISATQRYNNPIKPVIDGYLNANFSSDYLGGGSGQGYSSSASPCEYVFAVQVLSQCSNFDTVGPQFLDFDTLVSQDVRLLPSGAACSGNGIDSGIVDVANNKDAQYVQFDTFDEFSDITSGSSCSDPIDTGLEYEFSRDDVSWSDLGGILFGDKSVYAHKVCANPGCYYDRDADRCREM